MVKPCPFVLTVFRVEKLGYEVPVFDFRLPGVTSMSADIHKYGLGIKVGYLYCKTCAQVYENSHSNCCILLAFKRYLVECTVYTDMYLLTYSTTTPISSFTHMCTHQYTCAHV